MAKNFGLGGKGADALLSGVNYYDDIVNPSEVHKASGDEMMVDINKLKPNPYQPRTEFTEESLNELSESIKLHGVIQPVLAEDNGDGTYFIIAGERRTRAAERAGLKQVPVLLRKYSDEIKLEVALIENIQRENLNPVEEAKAYQRIMQMENIGQDEVARKVGKNRSTVANSLRILKLPEDMLKAVSDGKISSGHARALLSVVNPSDQRILFAKLIGSSMSVREAERAAGEMNGTEEIQGSKSPKKTAAKNPDIEYLENQFLEALGTKVSIKGSLERGTLSIEYFSREDLDRLYGIIAEKKL